MKKFATLALLLTFFCSSAFALKIAKIDIRKISTSIKEGIATNNQLKKEFESKQKILKKSEDKIKKMRSDYDKQSLVMNDKAKAKKQIAIQQAFEGHRQKMMKFQEEIGNKEKKLKAPIMERLKGVIDAVSKTGGYDLVFEVATGPVYMKGEEDISEKVIKAYDKKFK